MQRKVVWYRWDYLNTYALVGGPHRLDNLTGRITDIFNATFEDALSSISSRTSELTIHTKTVLAATKEAEKAAKSIRLETATKVIHSATEAVRGPGQPENCCERHSKRTGAFNKN